MVGKDRNIACSGNVGRTAPADAVVLSGEIGMPCFHPSTAECECSILQYPAQPQPRNCCQCKWPQLLVLCSKFSQALGFELNAEQDQLPCGSTGTTSGNCQEMGTHMI